MKTCPWCGCTEFVTFLKLKDYFLTQEDFEIVQCNHCGILFTDPRPSGKDAEKYYQSEKYLSHHENKKGLVPRLYEFVKSFNLRHKVHIATKDLPTGSVLDIGCGVGDFLVKMKAASWSVTGIEPSEQARQIASKRLGFQPLTPADYAQIPDESFDLITLWHVLEHIDDLSFQVHELQRLLKPGGRLVVALPNFNSFDGRHYKQYWAAWDVPRHLTHFNLHTAELIFEDTSIRLFDYQKLNWDAYYISYLSETYMKHAFPLLRGAFVGLWSNLKALKTGDSSSMVYMFKKV